MTTECKMDEFFILDGWEVRSLLPCPSLTKFLQHSLSVCLSVVCGNLAPSHSIAAFSWSRLTRSASHGSDQGRRRVYSHLQAPAHAPCKLTPLSPLLSSYQLYCFGVVYLQFLSCPVCGYFIRGDAANPLDVPLLVFGAARFSGLLGFNALRASQTCCWAVLEEFKRIRCSPRFSIFWRSRDVVLVSAGNFGQDFATRFFSCLNRFG